MNDNIEFIKSVDIFSLLSDEELEMIIGNFHFLEFDGGQTLFHEGDKGNEMFIVKSGSVKTLLQLPDGNEKELAVFTQGDFFGEMSIFENAARSATCRTVEHSNLISLRDKDLFAMIDRNPEIAIKIMYRMLNITTQRLRDTGEFLSDMVQWGEAARKRTITDEFTGAYNRRFLDNSLPEYFENARKMSKPLSLIMVDLDSFREINEVFGNTVGDKVILEMVSLYKQHLRESDILARYGGDEFTVILPDKGISDACAIAEKVRDGVEKLDLLKKHGKSIKKLTVSQGVASYPESAKDLDMLKKMADQALYKAKESGRNRVHYIGRT